MGTALWSQCIEAWLLLRLHERNREGLPRQEWGRKEVDVEKRTKNRKEWFWFKEKNPDLQQEHTEEKQDEGSVTEEEVPMVEVMPEETQVERMMRLSERVTALENENGELKRTLEEMEAKLALHDATAKGVFERCAVMENAIV